MHLNIYPLTTDSDFYEFRNFLREVFLLNRRLEHSWHVARLDYWRWHGIATCHFTPPFDQVTTGWKTASGKLAAVIHPIGYGEMRMHIHPDFRSSELENEMAAFAEEHYAHPHRNGKRIIIPVFSDDSMREAVLKARGYIQPPGWNHHYWRDLDDALPEIQLPAGYTLRSMGNESEYAARSWCSWRAFHPDEPDTAYDSDVSWYRNMQSAPLYQRDLDIVAATSTGELAGFCTIFYDDYTRSAVTVVVGVSADHWRRGLGKAVMLEGMCRLKQLGCTRVFSTAGEEPADALYRSLMQNMKLTNTWVKEL